MKQKSERILKNQSNEVNLMYKATDRERLLNKIISFMRDSSEFEGLLQIGSGAIGFADIYSDIDLMAGCCDADCVKDADQQLQQFFTELEAKQQKAAAAMAAALPHSAWQPPVAPAKEARSAITMPMLPATTSPRASVSSLSWQCFFSEKNTPGSTPLAPAVGAATMRPMAALHSPTAMA